LDSLLLFLFFLSGFAALLYQMVWQRLLAFFGGADVYSVTIIVSAFMAGLGIGSLVGGHAADRLSPRGRLVAFALAELGIAAFALVSVPLYYGHLYSRWGALGLGPWSTAVILFLSLLPPTFLMGVSLPLLSRAVTGDARESAARIAALYGWNTLGAAAGSICAVFVLVRSLGFQGTVYVGAALNAVCAAAVSLAIPLLVARQDCNGVGSGEPQQLPSPALATKPGRSLTYWIGLYTASGFVALSLEIVWFRILGTILKSNSFTFSCLLAVYLLGVGGGALGGRVLARRLARPDKGFLLLQCLVPTLAVLLLSGLLFATEAWGFPATIRAYLAGPDPLDLSAAIRAFVRFAVSFGAVTPYTRELAERFLWLYVLVPLVLVLPSTLLMGASFPLLQRAVQTDVARIGRRVGWLQAANIAGSTGGAILTGLVLLHVLGSAGTLRVLLLGGGVFLAMALASTRLRAGGVVLAMGAAIALCMVSPSGPTLWARLHGTSPDRILYGEDGSGTSVLKAEESASGPMTVVYINGIGESHLPFGGYHTVLGALPVLLHPDPKAVCIIGLGSGDTLYASGGRPGTESLVLIEILAPQLGTLISLDRSRPTPGLGALLRDPRIDFMSGDGRAFLMRTPRRFDVIQADALRPYAAYAGNLYSYEYFRLLGSRLTPGGFAVSWGPTERTRAAFLRAFPHAAFFGHTLVGSNEPIRWERDVVRQRMREPRVEAYYHRVGIDLEALVGPVVDEGPVVFGPADPRPGFDRVNTDLFPYDEYMADEVLIPTRRRAQPPGPRQSRTKR
jgi:spermidine synthase